MSMGPSFSPHPGAMQHPPGVPQGHPGMAPGMAHNPSQPGVQPGGMPHQMHMGVSGPGPQVNPAALMGGVGMPPGAGPNPHMQQLSQQQMFQHQQQQQMNNMAACESSMLSTAGTTGFRYRTAVTDMQAFVDANNPAALQHLQAQRMNQHLQQQQARQMLMAQQSVYGGLNPQQLQQMQQMQQMQHLNPAQLQQMQRLRQQVCFLPRYYPVDWYPLLTCSS